MFRLVILFAVLLPGMLLAQTSDKKGTAVQAPLTVASRFDPAVFFTSVRINQMYGHGNIDTPEGMQVAFVDTIWSNERAIGFSMRFDPMTGTGWRMWLDFDADIYYRPRLVRMLAQRPMENKQTGAFTTFRDWVATVQERNIGAPVTDTPDLVSWPWLTRTSYFLTLKQESLDGASWLLLVLQREHM